MSALLTLPLNIDPTCDLAVLVTILGANGAQVALEGVTAELALRTNTLDPAPLFTVSTTSSSSGSLLFGVAPPAPVGANCVNLAELEAQGFPLTFSTTAPVPVVATVANLAALATLPTTGFTVAQIALVAAGAGSFFQWSPSDPLTPNGTTIVAGVGGNWLLAGTVGIVFTAAATALFAGYDQGVWDLLVTWADGTTTKLLGETAYVTQTETP